MTAEQSKADLVHRQGARVSRVSRVSPQRVRDLFDFRALLEPEAMHQANA